MGSLLVSNDAPAYRYAVSGEIVDLAQLGRDITDEEMRELLSDLHLLARLPGEPAADLTALHRARDLTNCAVAAVAHATIEDLT